MTTEDDFHARLDECPYDHDCRLVFADWLQERDDPRAEGYRALGRTRTFPDLGYAYRFVYAAERDWPHRLDHSCQPRDRPEAAEKGPLLKRSRREAEDAVALAFGRLPPERRAELLGE